MYMKDVLRYCEEHGKKITKMGIYYAGKKNNFIFKVEGKNEMVFDREKFLEWFRKATEEIPKGYISVSEMRKKYNIPLTRSYEIVKDPRLNVKCIGSGKGIKYVDESRLREVISDSENKRRYNWES